MRSFDDVIMLDAPSTVIHTPVVFDEIDTPALTVNGLVSGVDVDKWYEQLVWKRSDRNQSIGGELICIHT